MTRFLLALAVLVGTTPVDAGIFDNIRARRTARIQARQAARTAYAASYTATRSYQSQPATVQSYGSSGATSYGSSGGTARTYSQPTTYRVVRPVAPVRRVLAPILRAPVRQAPVIRSCPGGVCPTASVTPKPCECGPDCPCLSGSDPARLLAVSIDPAELLACDADPAEMLAVAVKGAPVRG